MNYMDEAIRKVSKPDPSEATSRARALLEQITSEPWEARSWGPYPLVTRVYGKADPPTVALLYRAEDFSSAPNRDVVTQADKDAEFIAAAPDLVRVLLQRIEMLETAFRNDRECDDALVGLVDAVHAIRHELTPELLAGVREIARAALDLKLAQALKVLKVRAERRAALAGEEVKREC